MQKDKICPICQAFIDKNYIPEMILHINKLIILREPAEVLNKERRYWYNIQRRISSKRSYKIIICSII